MKKQTIEKEYLPINNIEDLLKSRRKHPVATLKLIKDIARRIKKLEGKI